MASRQPRYGPGRPPRGCPQRHGQARYGPGNVAADPLEGAGRCPRRVPVASRQVSSVTVTLTLTLTLALTLPLTLTRGKGCSSRHGRPGTPRGTSRQTPSSMQGGVHRGCSQRHGQAHVHPGERRGRPPRACREVSTEAARNVTAGPRTPRGTSRQTPPEACQASRQVRHGPGNVAADPLEHAGRCPRRLLVTSRQAQVQPGQTPSRLLVTSRQAQVQPGQTPSRLLATSRPGQVRPGQHRGRPPRGCPQRHGRPTYTPREHQGRLPPVQAVWPVPKCKKN